MLAEFVAFKVFLLASAFSVSQWDKSSALLPHSSDSLKWLVAERFITWDSVYFVSTAVEGPKYEHVLAFSQLWSQIISRATTLLSLTPDYANVALVAASISLLAHYAACATLKQTGRLFAKRANQEESNLAALLYIISPAGIFLSCGYTESTFAVVSFLGLVAFFKGQNILSAGVFAASVLIRSNGILWVILFAYQAVALLLNMAKTQSHRNASNVAKLISHGIAAALIVLAFVAPQIQLYFELCPQRPWCSSSIPLAYGFIQKTYWNVGFLKYWTTNNLSNFVFAAPTLILLIRSARIAPGPLAAVHFAIAFGALFFWHVQIITRLASCLPTPYIFIAQLLQRGKREGKIWATFCLVWALAQAVLFGAFLPPA